ncbi:MAG: UDP-N-acetylmuramoyl-L-alanyl-D-glutamate--2,6-diaminopimelate ligase [Oscillospiraceae bacterium]|nr:UDP-N-acetylmuramoyl-L-alanyl-D-glutamate--2,6-diaminopimelate ligase [Oscillospiraceae bacterium]
MKLRDLLRGVAVVSSNADFDMEIPVVAYDSRKVTPGGMFVAISGFASDGNRFIPMAMEKGAAVIITGKKPQEDVPYVQVENDRLALALIGSNYYGEPAKALTLIGVTGTNGKTSTTWLLKQVLEKVTGGMAGLIGTMENRIGDEVLPTDRTTPESFELQGLFARMRDAGCRYCIMEVSSHAIALDRVGGVHFDVAAFTNLTEDHLDFHKTMEDYCDTKAVLFSRCDAAVLNRDDAWFARISRLAQCPKITTSAKETAGIQAKDVQLLSDGIRFTAVNCGGEIPVSVPIPGRFTVYNVLTVLGIVQALGVDLSAAVKALANAEGVRGRVEVVPTPGKPYTVLIDYAHTPDGLDNVLRSVRDFCKGRLISVFGCGGDRDPIKRPIMGRIGAELSDVAVITSDNPRTEDPMAIIEDVLKGIDSAAKNVEVIENRKKAIQYAMDIGQKDDIIVLAGKGHETYQEICGVKHHLDEREVVAAYLQGVRI